MAGSASWWREPGTGAYARTEREWRWLLPALPADAAHAVDIEDRYLAGTTLRLRRMHGADGDVYKLTQKVRPRADDPSVVALTNIYLTPDEHARIATLPADVLSKRRHRWLVGADDLAVDELLGRWRGLALAELEHESTADRPDISGVDVTGDDRFSGGSLAAATDSDAAGLLDVVRRLLGS
ncbi:MAG TPA: hypothetical protein VFJ17_11285 [Mycobacteriales bacterium]|nr:hypothetical protein [Mycobacteriales bacterium]